MEDDDLSIDLEMGNGDGNLALTPEVWLQALLTINADKERRDQMIDDLAMKSGIARERVEAVLKALLKALMEQTGRAN